MAPRTPGLTRVGLRRAFAPSGGGGGPAPGFPETLAGLYAFGLSDDPVLDNTLLGSYFNLYFDTDGHLSIRQATASNGSDFDSHPAAFLQRYFNLPTISGLIEVMSARYTGDGHTNAGGVIRSAQLVDDSATATFYTETLSRSQPTVAEWYDPVIAGNSVSQVNWDLLNRIGFGSTTPIYFNSDGVHFRSALMPVPSEGPGYRIKAEQIAMRGAGVVTAPVDGSVVSHVVTGPGFAGIELARWDVMLDDQNFGSAQAAGHHEFWASDLTTGPHLAMGIFHDRIEFDVGISALPFLTVDGAIITESVVVNQNAQITGDLLVAPGGLEVFDDVLFDGNLDVIGDVTAATFNGAALPSAAITQLTGDVTAGPGSGSQVATIPTNSVALAKLANASSAGLMVGRKTTAGGAWEEISPGWYSAVIDFKTTGTYQIIPPCPFRLDAARVDYVPTATNACSVGATTSIGSNSANFDNWQSSAVIAGMTSTGVFGRIAATAVATNVIDLTTSGLQIKVTTGATATTMSGRVVVSGALLPV